MLGIGRKKLQLIGAVVAAATFVLFAPPVTWAGPSRASVPGDTVTTARVVALALDDGPSPYTAPILQTLGSYGAHATFFEIGQQVAAYGPTVRSIVAAGDEIGNHSYSHPDFLALSNAAIRAQLQETQDVVHRVAGVTPLWFHPPGGNVDGRIVTQAAAVGLRTVLWSVDPRDWSLPGTTAIVRNVLANTRPGSIILLHDGGGNRSETLAALPIILRTLSAEGYRFVTVSRLFDLPVQPPRPACSPTRAQQVFSHDGISAVPAHAIYRAWLQRYCSGNNLGPATGHEYSLTSDLIAQDFRHTAHRIEWSRSSGAIHVTLMWPWASAVFSERGIYPRSHTPITRAWFDQYFHFHDWGPALQQPYVKGAATIQCFVHGCAAARGGTVTWQKS